MLDRAEQDVEAGEKIKDSAGEFASNVGTNIHGAVPEIHADRVKRLFGSWIHGVGD